MRRILNQICFALILTLTSSLSAYSAPEISLTDALVKCKNQLVIDADVHPGNIPQASDEISKKAERDMNACMESYGYNDEKSETNSDDLNNSTKDKPGFFKGLAAGIVLWIPLFFILFKLTDWGLKFVENFYFLLSISAILTLLEFFIADGNILNFLGLIAPTILMIWFFKANDSAEKKEKLRLSNLTPAQRKTEEAKARERSAKQVLDDLQRSHGRTSNALVCPHCQTKGSVRSKSKVLIEKSRVNSVAGKVIGLGMNKEKQVTQLH